MSLVYNTNISKTEYLVDLENNGKAKQTALLSMSSTAPSGTFQKGSQYFNSTDKKIYTAVEDNVWGTTGKDPNFGIIYQCNNEYYVWDGDNLITTDLEGYEKLVNKATNFNTVNNTKYPTTKAVADYVVKESIVRNFTDAGITKTTSSDVFSDRTNNTGLAEEILAKQFPTGTTLYGEVRNQGMPTGIGNAEIRVEILETKSNGAQVIEFTLFSVDIEPKEWSHIYFSARTEQQNPWVWIPKAVPTDDYTSSSTTTVPTSKALSDGLALKQDISNISNDYNESSENKYPSSKALSDGLNASFPTIVKNSASSLPSASGYSIGDKFLQTSAKKIYTPVINGYIANNNTNIQGPTVDYNTGITTNFILVNGYGYCTRFYLDWNTSWNSSGETTKTYSCKFKVSSLTNIPIFSIMTSQTSGPSYNAAEFAISSSDNKIHHIMFSGGYSYNVSSDIAILDTIIDINTVYVLTIKKTGTDCIAQLTLENGTVVEEKNFTTTDFGGNLGSCGVKYGYGYVNTTTYAGNNLTVYLVDSYGDILVPNTSTLSWDSGTSITDKTEYADKTNGILYIYKDNELLAINIASTFASITGQPSDNIALNTVLNNKQDKNLLFTSKSASTWVADNTYPDYAYKCVISCTGVTANTYAIVNFAQTEADSGNYATVCETGNGTVTIYSKVNDSITIPSIVVMGV